MIRVHVKAIKKPARRTGAWGLAVLVLAGLLLTPPSARAFVPPAGWILDRTAKAIGYADTLVVEQVRILYSTDPGTRPAALDETVRYRFPDAFRSDIRSPGLSLTEIEAFGRRLTLIDDKPVNEPATLFSRYKDVLLYRTRGLLADALRRSGVDVTVASLGRTEDKQVVYVLGAVYPNGTRPRILIDRESFLPVEWVLSPGSGDGSDAQRVTFLGWSAAEGLPYPREIAFFLGDRRVREMKIRRVAVDAELESGIFDMTHIAGQPAGDLGPGDAQNSGLSDEVKRTIEEFKRKFE